MAKFYVTYGIASNLARCYSMVEAETYDEARDHIDNVTAGKFAFCYNEIGFGNQIEKYNLRLVDLQPQILLDNHG